MSRYRVEPPVPGAIKPQSLRAVDEADPEHEMEISSRVVVKLERGERIEPFIAGRSATVARKVTEDVFILQLPDAWSAAQEAERLSRRPGVKTSIPVMRRGAELHGPYARKPNDFYFPWQWHLENRDASGTRSGVDLNVRAAWPQARGEGVIVAVVDNGIELDHPDLVARVAGAPHFNFIEGTTDGRPVFNSEYHGTAVAGLIAAEENNNIGITAVAPGAQLASWRAFNHSTLALNDEQLMDMFQYKSNVVAVQNHSWGFGGIQQRHPDILVSIGISNAVHFGRGGKGVVMIRSAGNSRTNGVNANDSGYTSDPRVIAVAAVRSDGRFAAYSNPGACLLVAAPSSGDLTLEPEFPALFTTDRLGTNGFNSLSYTNQFGEELDFNNYLGWYAGQKRGFTGTSGSAPQIAGIAALALSVNTNLTWRDVQQILIHSARHWDVADPAVKPNGAGFLFSHNVGFGVPDAGEAVRLAMNWINRPPQTNLSVTVEQELAIPDDGLRVVVSGLDIPENLASIPATASLGVHADDPTLSLPLVDVGLANEPIEQDLTGKGALIQRGGSLFVDKINRAADAGAAFAVIYSHIGGDQRVRMGMTDLCAIPAVFISQNHGEALRDLLQVDSTLEAQLRILPASYTLTVTNTLLCEHVAVRAQLDHPRRGDLRITLVSPSGTRSILQAGNNDTSALHEWTYYSTQHFYESSAGEWRIEVSDQEPGMTGVLHSATLTLYGVDIEDSDGDGLDDGWELAHFGSLDYGPKDDPNGNGYQNAREQVLGTNPLESDVPPELFLSRWNDTLARLAWRSSTNFNYEIRTGPDVHPLTVMTNVPGKFPLTEWFVPFGTDAKEFFQIKRVN